MTRKCTVLAIALVLIAMVGFAVAHAKPLKAGGPFLSFSPPPEPASALFRAAGEAQVVLPVERVAEEAEVAAAVVRTFVLERVALAIPPRAERIFPVLWHRPPPSTPDSIS